MNIRCSLCKEPIESKGKYFYLSIKYRGDYKESMKLKLCSFKCLKHIVENPAVIIVELL